MGNRQCPSTGLSRFRELRSLGSPTRHLGPCDDDGLCLGHTKAHHRQSRSVFPPPSFCLTCHGDLSHSVFVNGIPMLHYTAYPPDCSLAVLPSNIYFTWTEVSAEKFIVADAMRLLAARLVKARIQDRQDLRNAVPCVNYAFFGTPVEAMCAAAYGANQSRLREIKKKYDPDDVMGLAGRWIINV